MHTKKAYGAEKAKRRWKARLAENRAVLLWQGLLPTLHRRLVA